LRDPGACRQGADSATDLREVWQATVEEVALRWELTGASGVWLPEEQDLALQGEVAAAIREGDQSRARQRIDAWRAAWLEILKDANRGKSLSPCRHENLSAVARREDGVSLFDWLASSDFTGVEKEVFRAEVFARIDALIEESEGHRPPANPTVHQMFDKAYEHFGTRDLEERSITAWLKRNAPEVSALWPDAPLEASWFDWRLKAGGEYMGQLDAAFKAALKHEK